MGWMKGKGLGQAAVGWDYPANLWTKEYNVWRWRL